MVRQLVVDLLGRVPMDDVMAHVTRVSSYDRYQASLGIAGAAAYVANAARAIGLEDVSIERYPADGKVQWWSYKAPLSWTPVVARLQIHAADRLVLEVDHAEQPFSVATYSAATPRAGILTRLVNIRSSAPESDVAGAIVVIPRSDYGRSDLIQTLVSNGAVGFITDAPCCQVPPENEYPGRIELDPETSLFGFSLTSRELELVRAQASQGARAHVTIQVDRSASMPVVTAVLPGEVSNDEIWLTAHLCHPRPGANDNASGVAALLGVAASLMAARGADRAWHSGRAIRFLWGPEFVGIAATLHRRSGLADGAVLPSTVINLDMVGEDQSLCGGPFLVERNPDCIPALINPLAEQVVSEVFACTAAGGGTWSAAPFLGFSDHALFADPSIRRPAIQLCHAPDRFNHSSGDSLEKVSDIEMLRATVAGALLAHIMASNGALSPGVMGEIVRNWCSQEVSAAQRIARHHGSVDHGDWAQDLLHYVNRRNCALLAMLIPGAADDGGGGKHQPPAATGKAAVVARWPGPFNTRAMIADMPSQVRTAVSGMVRSDKQTLALLFNFAIRVDGYRDRKAIISETAFALARPIPSDLATRLFDAMVESRWVDEKSETARAV